MLTLLASMLMGGMVCWLLFGVLTTLCYRFIRQPLLTTEPDQASKLILGWLSLPPLAALLITLVMYSPDLTQWLVAGHCHLGSCRPHGPQSALAVWPAAALVSWLGLRTGRCLFRQWLGVRQLSATLSVTGRDVGPFVRLDNPEPAAFTLGWLTPKIYITAGMQSACSTEEIDCILAHERAHRRRHDNLRLLIARLLSAPLPQSWSAAVIADLGLCCEKASDLRAAREFSRESVATALIRVARLQQSRSPVGTMAFTGTQTERRIRALLDEPVAPLGNEYVFAATSAALLFILFIVNPLHRAIELIP